MPTAQPSDWGFASALDDVGGAVAIVGIGDADHTQGLGPHDARRSRPRRSSARSPTPASRPTDIDGIMYVPFSGDQFDRRRVPRALRHRARALGVGRRAAAWCGPGRRPYDAALAIRAGQARRTSSTPSRSRGRRSARQMVGGPGQVHAEELFKQNLEVPFGWFPQPVYFATIARRHMHEFGTTPEQLGAIAVACRRHANLTPGAVMRDKPLTLDDYLAQPADRRSVPQGGLLPDLRRRRRVHHDVARARARPARSRSSRSLGVGVGNSRTGAYWSQQGDVHRRRRRCSPRRARSRWRASRPADVDVLACYDPFTIVSLMQIEDIGFCAKGEGGPLRRGRHAALRRRRAALQHARRHAVARLRARHRARRRDRAPAAARGGGAGAGRDASASTAATPARRRARSSWGGADASPTSRSPTSTGSRRASSGPAPRAASCASRAATACARLVWYPEPPCRCCGGDAPRRGRRSADAAGCSRGSSSATPWIPQFADAGAVRHRRSSRSRRIPAVRLVTAHRRLRARRAALRPARARRLPAAALRRHRADGHGADVHARRRVMEADMSELVLRGREHRLPDHRRRRARERAAGPLAGARAGAPAGRARRRCCTPHDGDVWSLRRRQEAPPARAHRHRRAELPAVPAVGHALRRDPAGQLRHRSAPRRPRRRRLYAQILYPSVTLAGARTYSDDRELQLACVRAYNEWLLRVLRAVRRAPRRRRRSSRRPASTTRSPSSSGRSSTATAARSSRPSRTARYEPTAEDDRFWAIAAGGRVPARHPHRQLQRRRACSRRVAQSTLSFLAHAGGVEGGRRHDPGRHQGALLGRVRALPAPALRDRRGQHRLDPDGDGAGRRHVPALPLVHRRRRA